MSGLSNGLGLESKANRDAVCLDISFVRTENISARDIASDAQNVNDKTAARM